MDRGGWRNLQKLTIGLKHSTVLKVVLPEIMDDHDMVTRFVEEARITSQLQHGNIVPVNDIGILDNSRIFYSMYLIEGEELEAIIKELASGNKAYEKKYSMHSLLSIFRKVCDACAFAHSKKILHRDIKPDNIMVGNFGDVYLMEWGLAAREEFIGEDVEMDDDLSQSTAIIKLLDERDQYIRATPAYMSPEQAYGKTTLLDRRTDIFLLGATLYAIATLCEPYTGDTLAEAMSYARTCNFIPTNNPRSGDSVSTFFHTGLENLQGRFTTSNLAVDAQTWTFLAFRNEFKQQFNQDISTALNYFENNLLSTWTLNGEVLNGSVWFQNDSGIWLEGMAQYGVMRSVWENEGNTCTDSCLTSATLLNTMSKMQQSDGGLQTFSTGYRANTENPIGSAPPPVFVFDATPEVVATAWRYFHIENFNPFDVVKNITSTAATDSRNIQLKKGWNQISFEAVPVDQTPGVFSVN